MVLITIPQPGTADGEVNKHWFLRGVQSAIFYYISCSPYREYRHKRRRRQEELDIEKRRSQVIDQQPGLIRQPRAFETNEAWAEDLILGPGPPKGWKPDNLVEKLKKRVDQARPSSSRVGLPPTVRRRDDSDLQPFPDLAVPESSHLRENPRTPEATTRPDEPSEDTPTSDRTLVPTSHSDPTSSSQPSGEHRASTDEESEFEHPGPLPTRPSFRQSFDRRQYERRISTAMENFKGSLRYSINPEKWNWRRYERDDENLVGISDRMTRMWNRATTGLPQDSSVEDRQANTTTNSGRKRATTMDSDRYSWHRVRHPAINDLHPPVVSSLPSTRAEAAWMLLPPPSAAVMAGKIPPGSELRPRWPICVMGRVPSSEETRAQSVKGNEEQFPGYHRPSEGSTEDFSDVDDQERDDDPEAEGADQYPEKRHQSDPGGFKALEARPPSMHVVSPERRSSWSFQYYVPRPTAA